MSLEKTKTDIFNLIATNQMDKAFELIKTLLPGQGEKTDKYYKLTNEYIDQPGNFTLGMYMTRLRAFVNTLESDPGPAGPAKPGPVTLVSDKVYDLLCSINFETQTTYFRTLYRRKNVSSFILYGENNNDLRWLYHQLLHLEGLTQSKPVSIDYSSTANNSFEQLLELLYDRFDIPNKQPKSLRFKIESFLQTSPLVIIIKYPAKKIAELNEFYKSFYDLFKLLYDQISDDKKPITFLFVEDMLSEYAALDKDYFLWHHDIAEGQAYQQVAIRETKPKIMDLSPIRKLTAPEVKKWLEKNLDVPAFDPIYCDPEKCLGLREEGDDPYYVIDQIHNAVKTDSSQNTNQWLIH